MVPQTKSLRTRHLSRSGIKGKGAYAGVLQAGMDEKLATDASGGHGARWLPCHGYGTEGEKLRIGTVNVGTLRGPSRSRLHVVGPLDESTSIVHKWLHKIPAFLRESSPICFFGSASHTRPSMAGEAAKPFRGH